MAPLHTQPQSQSQPSKVHHFPRSWHPAYVFLPRPQGTRDPILTAWKAQSKNALARVERGVNLH